jgi:hypothetical protein
MAIDVFPVTNRALDRPRLRKANASGVSAASRPATATFQAK